MDAKPVGPVLLERRGDVEPRIAPVAREWSGDYTIAPDADRAARARMLQRCRITARLMLTTLQWHGNVHAATEVVDALVGNAVVHASVGRPGPSRHVKLRLAVTEADELLVEVTDQLPAFPDFSAAVAGEKGRGLWNVRRRGGEVTWSCARDFRTKTVRARLTAGEVPQ